LYYTLFLETTLAANVYATFALAASSIAGFGARAHLTSNSSAYRILLTAACAGAVYYVLSMLLHIIDARYSIVVVGCFGALAGGSAVLTATRMSSGWSRALLDAVGMMSLLMLWRTVVGELRTPPLLVLVAISVGLTSVLLLRSSRRHRAGPT
jgi:hypothetical protein